VVQDEIYLAALESPGDTKIARSYLCCIEFGHGIGLPSLVPFLWMLLIFLTIAIGRIMETPASYPMIIHGPEDVYHFIRPRLVHEPKEHFLIVILNTKNYILATPTISVGSLTASVVHPREIFSEALKYPCASIILVHNHPSGNPEPSREDIAVTKRIQNAGNVLDIPVLDHIIIGEHTFSSLKEKGVMSDI